MIHCKVLFPQWSTIGFITNTPKLLSIPLLNAAYNMPHIHRKTWIRRLYAVGSKNIEVSNVSWTKENPNHNKSSIRTSEYAVWISFQQKQNNSKQSIIYRMHKYHKKLKISSLHCLEILWKHCIKVSLECRKNQYFSNGYSNHRPSHNMQTIANSTKISKIQKWGNMVIGKYRMYI